MLIRTLLTLSTTLILCFSVFSQSGSEVRTRLKSQAWPVSITAPADLELPIYTIFDTNTFFNFDPWPAPIPIEPWPPIEISILPVIIWSDNPCDDQFYESGVKYSSCECDDEGDFHGKSVYWDQKGNINSVKYFNHGKLHTLKNYDEGKVVSISKYKQYKGLVNIHGKKIFYSPYANHPDVKTTTLNYVHGSKEGLEEEYHRGKKISEAIYKDNQLIQEISWNLEGDTTYKTYHEIIDNIENWTFIDYDPIQITYRSFDNGKMILNRETKEGKLIKEEKYLNSILTYKVSNFQNGTPRTRYALDENGISHWETWRYNKTKIEDYYLDENIYNKPIHGEGYQYDGQNKITFKQVFTSEGTNHLECWKIENGDTTEFYYADNTKSRPEEIIYSNKFIQYGGRAVKSGEWRTYQNNKIISITSYSAGKRHGNFVRYDTIPETPKIYFTGEYNNGSPSGTWSLRQDSSNIRLNYFKGKLTGDCAIYTIHRDSISHPKIKMQKVNNVLIRHEETYRPFLKCFYEANKLEDSVSTFWPNGNIHWTGVYLENERTGLWIEYDKDNKEIRRGNYLKGKPVGKWIHYEIKKNGKVKSVKDRTISEPEINFSPLLDITENKSLIIS